MHQSMTVLYLILSFVFVAPCFAQSGELSLDQAIINVLEKSPLLKASDYDSKAAAARIRSARLTPSYRTKIEFENFAGSGQQSGSGNLESTLSLSKVLELGGKAKLRGELSQFDALLLANQQATDRLDLLAKAAKYFLQIVADQENIIVATESLMLAKRTKKVVAKRVTAGKSANAELWRAEISLARSELLLEHARHALEVSKMKLVALWGETKVHFSKAEADLFSVKNIQPFITLETLLDNNPDLVRFATRERLLKTRILLAESSGKSDIEISGGLRYFNASDDAALVFSLDIPLGTASRASSKIETASILGEREPHLYQQRRLALHAMLFEIHQEIKHASAALHSLRETIIPLAKRALQDYEKGYAAGRYSFFELIEAQRVLLKAKSEAIDTATNYHRYQIEIDRLTGAGLSAGENK